ncbi:type VII secretion protein EccB [Micromonosporaceae bacterium B7E4]
MQSRRDQVQALRFVGRRMSAAVLGADPNSRDQPTVRLGRSAFAAVVVAALVVAGVTVYGLIVPGGARSWRDGDGLVVEKESGARYVFREGVLHPVLNYTSARLILGSASPTVRRVAAASLRGVPHGTPVGIPGAPESLPTADGLVRTAWQVCVHPGRGPDGASRPVLTVTVAGRPAPGHRPIGVDEALPVRGPDGATYLVWLGHRLRVGSAAVLAALGYAAVPVLPVGAGWLDVLPAGPDLAPLPVAGLGAPAPIKVDGRAARIGQVFTIRPVGADPQYFLLRGNELVALNELQATIQLTDPRIRAAYPGRTARPIQVAPSAVAGARRSGDPALPARPPRPVTTPPEATTVCVDIPTGGPGAAVPLPYLQPTAAPIAASTTTAPTNAHGGPVADQVTVPPGRAVLAVALPGPAAADGTWQVVSDIGVTHPLSNPQVRDSLGYGDAAPVYLPAAVVSLVPTGPRLDPADAIRTAPVTPPRPPETGR